MTESITSATLPGAEFHLLKSEIADDEFEITVAVLRRTVDSVGPYPVVYVLDANTAYAMTVQIAFLMMLGEELPEMILVGIGHPVGAVINDPTATQKWAESRRRHMAPTMVEALGGGGGAEMFMGFIRDELIPFVDSNYPTGPEDRTIVGDSMGGLFAFFVLLQHPGTFDRYIAGSPALSRDDDAIFKDMPTSIRRRSSVPLKLFTSVGSLESENMVAGFERMVETLESQNHPDLVLTSVVFDNETHLSVVGPTISRGLRAVFSDHSEPGG